MEGLFITLEGCDGLGKSAQARRLAGALRGLGHNVFETKEPGTGAMGSPFGSLVRDVLFKKCHPVPAGADQIYLLVEHIDNAALLAPHLERGETVICDRWTDSAFAYAAVHTEPTIQPVLDLWDRYSGPVPDLTILLTALDARPAGDQDSGQIGWALARARARTGSESGKQGGKAWNDYGAQRLVQDAYLARLACEPRTLLIPIRDYDTEDVVHARVMRALITRFQAWDRRLDLRMLERCA